MRSAASRRLVLALFFAGSAVWGTAVMSQQTVPEWARLPVGTGPVGIAIVDVDKQLGLDIVVLNSGPSEEAIAEFILAIADISKAAKLETEKPAEAARLTALGTDLGTYATISVLYGAREARFWRGTESLLYREVGANSPYLGRTLRGREIIACKGAAALIPVNRGRVGLLAVGNGSPYIFNWVQQPPTGTTVAAPSNALAALGIGDLNPLNWDIFYGAAKGTQEIKDLQFAAGERSVAVGDFDGDFVADLAVVERNAYKLSVYRGQSLETSSYANFFRTFPVGGERTPLGEGTIGKAGQEPYFVAAGDVNGDGKDDLVVALGGLLASEVVVLENRGDGTFLWPGQRVKAARQARSVAIGDFDRDGIAELVVAGLEELALLDRATDGTYGAPQAIGTLTGTGSSKFDPPFGMVVGDFNGDFKKDLAVANIGNDSVDIYLGNGDGTFSMERVTFSPGSRPIALAAGDLNEDGALDLAVALYGANEVAILLGKDASQGPVLERWMRPALGPGACALATGNLFGNGKDTDLAVAYVNLKTKNTPVVGVYQADSLDKQMGLLQPLQAVFQELGSGEVLAMPGGVAVRGVWDSKAGAPTDGSFAMITSPDGRTWKAYPYFDTGFYQPSLAVGALDGRQNQDLVLSSIAASKETVLSSVVAPLPDNSIWVWDLSDRAQTPQTKFTLAPEMKGTAGALAVNVQAPPLRSIRPRALAAVDVDRDGDTDVVYVDSKAGGVYVLTWDAPATAFRYTRPASGTTEPAFGAIDSCATGRRPSAIAAADFDGDGYVELAVANAGSDNVSILDNTTNMTQPRDITEGESLPTVMSFVVVDAIPVGSTPMAIVAGDFNLDGYPDLAVANFGADSVSILLNDGTGNFARQPIDVKVGRGPIALAVAYAPYVNEKGESVAVTLTGSAVPDLVVANFLSNDISVLVGTLKETKVTFVEKIVGSGNAAYDVMKNEVRHAGGAESAIGDGPIAVSVGFFDDLGKPMSERTLDVAVAVEFPPALLRSAALTSTAISNAVSDQKTKDALLKLQQDVFILYGEPSPSSLYEGPIDLGGAR